MGGLRRGGEGASRAGTSNACPIFYPDEDGDNKQQGQAHFTLLTPLQLSA